MKTNPISILALAGCAAWGSAFGEHWSEFRGSGQQGHFTGDADVPLRWGETQNIAWKTPIDGMAWSSPIVVGSRVFVTTAVEEGGLSLRVMALDMETGKPIWDTEVRSKPEAGRMHKKNSHASPTPVFDDGKIYAHFGHHGTYCLDARSGDIVWRQESIEYPPVHGTGGSPIVLGDRLIYSCDGAQNPVVVALDKKTGDIDWQTDRNVQVSRKFSFSTPLPIEVNGKTQVVVPGSGALISYDPETGKEIWRCLWGEGYSVVPRPVYSHGLVIACSGFNRANMIAVDPTGKGDVTATHKKWEISKQIPKESSPIVVGDLLFVNDDKGILSCVEVETGEVKYQERMDGQGGYSASPVYAGGHLYFHNGDGVTTVVKPSDRFDKVAENSIGEYGLSSFAVVEDGFVIRTESSLIRVAKK